MAHGAAADIVSMLEKASEGNERQITFLNKQIESERIAASMEHAMEIMTLEIAKPQFH
jgi:hypothetical protein